MVEVFLVEFLLVCFDIIIIMFSENCTWEYMFGECTKSCDGGERIKYPVIAKSSKGEGFCPDFVLNNETEVESCNNDPCSKYHCVRCPHKSVVFCLFINKCFEKPIAVDFRP